MLYFVNMSYPELRRAILEEFYHLLGIDSQPWLKGLVERVMRKPLDQFIEIALQFDALVATEGFATAARWVLPRFVRGLYVRGLESIPRRGALLIAANHPGAIDALLIPACLPRDDLRILASGLNFLRKLPSLQRYLIFVPRQGSGRAWAALEAIRHLQSGGTLLIFPSGGVDPEPSFLSEARGYLEQWSESLVLFLRRVPQTMVQTVICSHILFEKYFRHPLTRLGRSLRQRLVIAEYLQIAEQLWREQKKRWVPYLSFGAPVEGRQVLEEDATGGLQKIVAMAQQLLEEHVSLSRDRFTLLPAGGEILSVFAPPECS
ncbi:MAG: 1-acyl-sn-glycerol-3-phosphate acyltransferase [Anaerolineales bacterium]|nr:1-acyl-sn-glycerol-3-phosphate acyltransferase [Anaerolineales bacterium]MCS7248034.1 1-acyl-sn-glycerol-3-phosphate acyltransferase [Anaerolineales bacterium]MDW8161846.1 1-acyl-sn-glycerol-3-phosphate acyltransferase [Anaerolineales bacterium]MDW8446608.1 1-acyl-sn-glycerol-3-phosphate acyltransferase [Anaerolineales bacterium]